MLSTIFFRSCFRSDSRRPVRCQSPMKARSSSRLEKASSSCARSRVGHDRRGIAREESEGGAARQRRRDEGGARQAEGARPCRPTRFARPGTICSREFDYVNGRQSLREYVARNTVEVRVDEVARAGEVLDAAVGSGATSVSGVRFDLKDRSVRRARGVAESRGRRARPRRRGGRRRRNESRSRASESKSNE